MLLLNFEAILIIFVNLNIIYYYIFSELMTVTIADANTKI